MLELTHLKFDAPQSEATPDPGGRSRKEEIMKKPLKPGNRHLQGINFFVCACAACGEKQEVFATELHQPHHCRACGGVLDFEKCSFEPPPAPSRTDQTHKE